MFTATRNHFYRPLITQWVLPDHHLGILLRNFEPELDEIFR